jgi:CBS domain containing-hemolysin-like protein
VTEPLLWLLLVGLLLLSAAISASETALFSLTPLERAKAGSSVARLLKHPRGVLTTVLLANLVVNLLYFAFATRLSEDASRARELGWSIAVLAVLVLFGEALPKALALRARVSLARLSALPLEACQLVTRPVRGVLEGFIEALYRAIGAPAHAEGRITTEALARALEKSAELGLLHGSEAQLLIGVLELEETRVREIMTPRVDMVFLDRSKRERDAAIEHALERKLPWLIVIDGSVDRVVGRVRLRDLLVDRRREIGPVLQPVRILPEVASCAAALAFFRVEHVAQALVVDEWGGTAGLVTLEDVLEQVVGELLVEGETPVQPVQSLGDGRFRVDGSLSIREWNELFGRRVVPTEFETVAGFVAALLGRIPRHGDVVRSGPLVFEVHEVAARRILSVDMRVEDAQGSVAS